MKLKADYAEIYADFPFPLPKPIIGFMKEEEEEECGVSSVNSPASSQEKKDVVMSTSDH